MLVMEEIVFLEWLVQTGKEQMLVIFLECSGYLSPDVLQTCNLRGDSSLVHSLITAIRLAETQHFNPTAIPVVIQHHIETCADTIVDDLLHAGHPLCIDFAIAVGMDIPGARDAHRFEALCLHAVKYGL